MCLENNGSKKLIDRSLIIVFKISNYKIDHAWSITAKFVKPVRAY